MRPRRPRLATVVVAVIAMSLVGPGAVAAKEKAPAFPKQGTDALARNSWIVTLEKGADLGRAGAMSRGAGGKLGLVYGHALRGFQFKGSAKAAEALRHNPKVASVEADRPVYLTETVPFGIERVHAWSFSGPTEGAYQAGYRGAGARIAILDTGIDMDHPDLVANIDAATSRNCLAIGSAPEDGHGHGTHVSGTAAAPLNGEGVVGIAPEAQLVAVKMFDDAGNSSEALSLCALDWVTALNTDGNAANDIDVASMSWGDHRPWGSCAADALHGAICRASTSGAILVAGAGNDAADAGDFVPAAFPEVISVSGYTDLDGKAGGLEGCAFIPSLFWFECDDTFAFFSDYGPSVDVMAPGVNVNSTWTGGGYNTIDGTSMSTPHVAGAVALMRSANQNLTATEALDVFRTTGECPNGASANADGIPGCDGQGAWEDDPDGIAEPLVNALRAAQAAGNPPPPPPPPPPGSLDIPGVQGDWVGTYGADGWAIGGWQGGSGDLAGLPAYVTYAVEQGSPYLWTQDAGLRALENPDQTERRPSGWFHASQVRIRINFSQAYTGTVHLYALDHWLQPGRRATITANDGHGPFVVNLATDFSNGAWIHAPVDVAVGGSIVITVDRVAGGNAVLSGFFLGGAGVPPPPPPQPTVDLPGVQGDWVGAYGIDGYVIGGWLGGTTDLVGLSNGRSYTVEQGSRYIWSQFNGDVRALESPDQSERRASGWFNATQVRIRVNFASAYSGNLHLYTVDHWIQPGRRATIKVNDGSGPRAVNLANDFSNGAWVHFPINVQSGGSVVVTVDKVAGDNAILSGLFLGGGSGPPVSPPGAPTLTTATPGNGQVSLAWTAPASDGGSAITAYTATASPGGATCATSGATGCAVAGLTNGIAYSFSVTATNAAGTGIASNVLSATPRTVPGAPTLNSASAGNGQVALAWSAPTSNGGSAITAYTATAAPGGATCTTSSTACTISGLTNGVSYSFTVTATNAAGTGPASNGLSATPIAAATVPGAPTLTAATPGNGQVALGWGAPASNGGSAITGYTATASPGGATCSTTGGLSCSVSNLTNGTAYTFTVTATNAVGTGPASSPLSATPRTVPAAPSLTTATPGNGQVALVWLAPSSTGGSPITGYTATASPGGATCSTNGGLACTVIGLTNGTAYAFTVTATNIAGTGSGSNSLAATPRTVPGAPNLTTATPGNAQVVLDWTAPASNGGSPITGYTVTASPGGATCTTNGATSCTIGGLTNGTTYSFNVRAANIAGSGAPSNVLNATPRMVPGAPQNLTAAPHKTKGVNLAWAAPSTNGGAAITDYRIYRRTAGGTLALIATVNGSTTTYRDAATAKGVQYFYVVRAVNAAGEGSPSNEAIAVAK